MLRRWSPGGFPGKPPSEGKASTCNAGNLGSIPGSGRSPGEGNGNPFQYSCLKNPMDGGDWWATVHGVAKSRTRLSHFTFTFTLRLSVCWEHKGIMNFFSKGRSKPRSLKGEWTQKTSPFPGSSEFPSLPVKGRWQGSGQWSQETRKYKPWCFCPPGEEVRCPLAFLCLQLKTLT